MIPSTNRKVMPEMSPLIYLSFISHLLHIISKEIDKAAINPHITVKVVYFVVSSSSAIVKILVEIAGSALNN